MFGELGKVPRLRVELSELRFAASSARPLFPFFLKSRSTYGTYGFDSTF